MNILDDLEKIKKLDKSNALGSIEAFPEQLKQAWEETRKFEIPADFQKASNIVITGMGGSALGGRIVKSLFEKELKVPFFINTEYQLPGFVNQNSLVIVPSYSGNTEETLSCLADAQKRKAKIFAITTNGKLGEKIKTKEVLGLIFNPDHNPLGYPKTAIGYSIGLILGVLSRLEYVSLADEEFLEAVEDFRKIDIKNPAKKIAKNLLGKIGIFIASEHLKGAVHGFRNQVHEIAHSFSVYFDLPEMDHHLIEGFASPEEAKNHSVYYFFNSSFYHEGVAKRYPATREVWSKQRVTNFEYQLKSKSALAQVFELVNLGGFVAFYLSILKGEDPGPEPLLISLKEKLAK